MVVHGINLSTFTRKVRLALAEKGIDYRLEAAPMRSPHVFARNPLGQIPVLEDGAASIADSSVIIAYLERTHPAQPLYPAAPVELARALWIEEYADTRLREVTLPFFAERVVKLLFQGKPADEQALARAAGPRDECFDYLEKELGSATTFVAAGFSVADIAVGTQLVTYQQGGGDLPGDRWPRLAAHISRMRERPAWIPILAGEEESLAAARQRRRSTA
jgi:glutathione S-transferase